MTFAREVARRTRGRVQFGFKYFSEGRLPDGRPLCRLSLATRVVDSKGRPLVTLVDDNTVRDGLPKTPAAPTLHATDDLRLALLAERVSWRETPGARLEALRAVFDGFVAQGQVFDAFGNALLVTLQEPKSWHRVCEVVTRPLVGARERRAVVALVLAVANDFGCTLPSTAALHAHYDAKPWREVKALSRLVLEHAVHREAWWQALAPNPRCLKLAPFPADVVRVARTPGRVSFATFAAALKLAGASKECDLNLLGVIEPHPRQPTLEVRCLPMALEAEAVLASLARVEQLLGRAR